MPEVVEAHVFQAGEFEDGTPKLLDENEAADLLRISRRTLERMRVEGGGPLYLKVGGGKRSRVLYREGEILAGLERNSFGSTSECPR